MTYFLAGILAALIAAAPLVGYLKAGWSRALKRSIQRGNALDEAFAIIDRLTPLAETGRRRRAADAKFKAKGRGE